MKFIKSLTLRCAYNFVYMLTGFGKWVASLLVPVFVLALANGLLDVFNIELPTFWNVATNIVIYLLAYGLTWAFLEEHGDLPGELFGKDYVCHASNDLDGLKKLSWTLTIVTLVVIGGTWFLFFFLDTPLCALGMWCVLQLIHLLANSLDVDYKVLLLALIYLSSFVAVFSCLALLLPVFLNKSQHRGVLYVRSAVCSIAFYTCAVGGFYLQRFSEIWTNSVTDQCDCIFYWLEQRSAAYRTSVGHEGMNALVLPPLSTTTLNTVLFILLWAYKNRDKEEKSEQPIEETEETDEYDALFSPSLTESAERRAFTAMSLVVMSSRMVESTTFKTLCTLFHDFDPLYMARMTDEEVKGIAHNYDRDIDRLQAVQSNTRLYLPLCAEYGSFIGYLCSVTQSTEKELKGKLDDQELTAKAAIAANDLRHRGFKRIGPAAAADILCAIAKK